LIAPRTVKPAEWTGALYVSVRQEAVVENTERGSHGGLADVALMEQLQEHIVDHLAVVVRPCAGKQIEADAELTPRLEKFGVVVSGDLAGGTPLLLGSERDWRAVLVSPGDHEHVVAEQTVKAREDVTGQICAGDLPDVK